jgi:hypothetical protein
LASFEFHSNGPKFHRRTTEAAKGDDVKSALAVAGAIFLILELDQPFGGLIGISSEPMLNALHELAK